MIAAWERFWFARQSLAPLVLMRTVFGVLTFFWALSILPDATTFFGSHGVLGDGPHRAGAWTLLDVWGGDAAAIGLVVILGVAGLALAVGLWSRVTSVIVFIAFVSLGNRSAFIGNSGDGLMRLLSLYLVFASWTIRADGTGPAWPLRLVQIQLSVIYLATVWAKLRGVTWPDGTAVAYALRLDDLARFPLPDVGASLVLVKVMTWGVLLSEAAIGILVWVKRFRPWVLLLGVCLHLGIEYRLRVGFFSWAMLTTYLAFVSPAAAERVLSANGWLRSRVWAAGGSTP